MARRAFKEAKRAAKDARKIFKALKKSAVQKSQAVAPKPAVRAAEKKSGSRRKPGGSATKQKSLHATMRLRVERPSSALPLSEQSSSGATLGSGSNSSPSTFASEPAQPEAPSDSPPRL